MYARIQFALGPTNIELTPGQPFDLQLNISVPPLDHVPPTDFKIEVFGHAITGTVYTRFALFEPRLQMDDDSQSVANFTTHLNRSTEFPNIYHSGRFVISNFTTTKEGILIFVIRTALLKSSTMTSGSSYPISVAVTFGDGLFGWSQQAMYICSQADVTFDFNGVLAPSAGGTSGQIERRGADRIDVQLQYTNAFDELRLEVSGTSVKADVFSLTAIELQTMESSFGSCAAFRDDVNSTSVFETSSSGRTKRAVSRSFGNILNCGGAQPRSAGEDDEIVLGFGVVTDGEMGDTFTITVRVLLRGALKMTQSLTLTLIESTTATLGTKYQMARVGEGVKLALTEPAPGVPLDISPGRHVTFDMSYEFLSHQSEQCIKNRDPSIDTDVYVFQGQLVVTGTEAQPCGVSDGDRSEAVSPTLMPTDISVFDGNSSMVFWLGPTFYAGVMDYKPSANESRRMSVRLTFLIAETAQNPSVSVTFRSWETVTAAIPLMTESQRPNATTSRAFQMEGNITSTLPRTESTSTTLYAGGVVAFNMTVFVPPGGSYPDFRAMAARRETGLGQLRLCRASVVAVGANLPCNRYNFADATTVFNRSDLSHSHPEPDTGAVQLGSVCAVPTELLHGARDNLLVANFVYQHLAKFGPNNTFEDSNLPNPIYFNAIVESDAVAGGFAAQIGYATSTSRAKLAAVPASQPRKIWVSVRGAGPYRLGQTVLVDLNFKWNPGVISDAWWTITASEGEDQVKFCDIRVTHIGDNYACKQEAKQLPLIHKQSYDSPESDYGERTPFNSSRATSMVAHLMRYANAGLWPTYADTTIQDADTVSTSVAVTIPTSAGTTASFQVALNEVNFVWTETVQLQVDTSQTAVAAEPKSLTFVADSGEDWTVFPGVLKTFEVVLELDDNFERTVQLVLGSADDVPKYDACCAYVTFVGENIPCINVAEMETEISKSSPSVAGHDVLTFDMGRLCSVPIAPRNTTTHQLRVTLGVRPHSALTAGDQLGVTVTVLLDGTVMAAGAVFGQTPAPPTTTAAATTVDDAPLAEGDMALSEGDVAPTEGTTAPSTAPVGDETLSEGSATPSGDDTATSVESTTSSTSSGSDASTSGRKRRSTGPGGPLTITFTVSADSFTGETTTGEISLVNSSDSTPMTNMSGTTWARFNVSVPTSSVAKLSLVVTGYSEHGRAAVVPTGGLRFLGRGRNVPCAALSDLNDTIELSSTLSNSQNDVISLDAGYVTNTGMSRVRYPSPDWVETDDMVQFEVELRFSDHPRATHETPLPVTLQVRYGSLESTITQGVALQRLGTELPDMELVAWADNDLPYLPNAQVPVDIIVRNRPNATADAINATVTLALPPYMAFGSVAWTNFSEPPAVAVRRHAVLLSWPRLLPGEGLHVQLLLTVDPTNKRGHGAGYAAAGTPIFLRATMFRRYGIPTLESGVYPPQGKLWYPMATPTYINFDVNSEDCYEPLGIASGLVADCQLSASSAAEDSRLAHMARMGPCAADGTGDTDTSTPKPTTDQGVAAPCVGSSGWSPEQRGTPFIHWHQVDFGNLTRVTGLLVARPAGTRRVTRFRLQHSLAGTVFQDIGPVMALNWSSLHSDEVVTHRLDRAVETRYVRFVIEEAETGDDKYIGLQVEYLGCRRSTDVLQETVCAVQPATPSAADAARNRQFAVDTANNHIYFCDLIQSRGRRACYVSHDSSSWRQLPNVIERMVGFDESSGKIYGAGRSPDTLLWSTDGGNTWAPEAKADFEAVSQAGGFFSAVDVPSQASGSAGFTDRIIGDWTASYHGLSQGGQLRVKWSALTCST
ncbi:uncharacterized protein LOC122386480 [Amphibalanus amphitrite]|uniref:uncharacterized protein LOC122386480 n=1 Tax=Amphibalanus amphitrite TaxID=1232801 RepID=UPI001C92454E|nr:uncharacterized protein LOC122386480 [Amphibalanus amphitrite]